MVTRKTLSQAETLVAEWAERRLVPGVYVPMSKPADGSPPLLLMLNDPAGAMRMDEPILEAVKAGLLAGNLPTIREGLIHRAILTEALAKVELWGHVARKHQIERQASAAHIVGLLKAFLPALETVADDTERAAEKIPEAAADFDTTDLRAILHHGAALSDLLDNFASAPIGDGANASKPVAREFFIGFDRWWREAASHPDQRGAKAIRNRLAAAVWLDFGREISGGYTPEAWAKDTFKGLGKTRKIHGGKSPYS